MENLIKTFLEEWKNPDEPILFTRQELEECLEDFLIIYEQKKHKKKVKEYPKK